MINANKKQNSKFDLSKFDAELNFAYCPSKALTLNSSLMLDSNEFKDLSESIDDKSISYLIGCMKYFYICYCVKIVNLKQDHNNYFYFQLFSQIGDQQSAAQPIYGFYTDEKILESIKDIDAMFYPEEYDKQIFDTFQNELFGGADQIAKLMQDWTDLKLLNFKDLYFKDEDAVKNLYKLIESNKDDKKIAKRKKTIKTKSINKNLKNEY